eukprot:scaffold133536_cov69-Phaeocystis_antarctica.AAC.4
MRQQRHPGRHRAHEHDAKRRQPLRLRHSTLHVGLPRPLLPAAAQGQAEQAALPQGGVGRRGHDQRGGRRATLRQGQDQHGR